MGTMNVYTIFHISFEIFCLSLIFTVHCSLLFTVSATRSPLLKAKCSAWERKYNEKRITDTDTIEEGEKREFKYEIQSGKNMCTHTNTTVLIDTYGITLLSRMSSTELLSALCSQVMTADQFCR